MSKVSRNDPCPCGSGKKFKQCCIDKAGVLPAQPSTPTSSFQQQFQLAAQLYQRGRLMDALGAAQVAAKLSPKNADAHHLLAAIYQAAKQSEEAAAEITIALKLDARNPMIRFTAGMIAADSGELAQAVSHYEAALTVKPDLVEARFNLGNTLRDLGRLDLAVEAFKKALAQRPKFLEALCNLGDLYRKRSEFGEAERCYRSALEIQPNAALIHSKRGLVLQRLSRLSEAVEAFQRAIELSPNDAHIHSNLLLASQYDPGLSREDLFARHRRFAACFEQDQAGEASSHQEWFWDGVRPLRIGYVSPDLRRHSVAQFAEPVIGGHDRSRFDVHVYYSNAFRDEVTERIQSKVAHWHDVSMLTDAALAQKIQADAIDILIDLSGHTAGHRLLVFVAKPAPIQVTWLGYPGTTGLSCIDYRLTDECLDPIGQSESMYSETLVRLPTYSQFDAPKQAVIAGPLPVQSAGFLTLACLNNTTKLNAKVLELWAQIMQVLPTSRLILGNANDQTWCDWVSQCFQSHGVDPQRVQFIGRLSLDDYLALHQTIDLALDPFPWNGGTTTMLSLWMGVPVVTLAGDRPAARLGVSSLAYAGVDGFVAQTLNEYVQRVEYWATHLDELAAVRASLREKMEEAGRRPTLNVVGAVERAYEDMARHKMSNKSSN